MRIRRVEPIRLDQYLLVEIETDTGLTGLGEAGAWGFLEASEAAIDKFARYLVGKDPLRIEHHWQYLYRWSAFRGSAVMSAISAIDIALWDIAGKHFDAPVYQLLGGRSATAPGYTRMSSAIPARSCCAASRRPVTPDSPPSGTSRPSSTSRTTGPISKPTRARSASAIDAVRQYRELVGDEVDLCIEIHRRMTPAEAVQLGRGIEQFHPFFFEDPVMPDNLDEMAYVAANTAVPIATGERLTSLWEFDMLLRRNAARYVRPDVCVVGGITAMKKIAALAEAQHVGVVPHNPLSPVCTAASLQVAACIPNLALVEYPSGEDEFPKRDMVTGIAEHDGHGYLLIPDRPGIGVELKPDARAKVPYLPREVHTRLHADGSVVDQ